MPLPDLDTDRLATYFPIARIDEGRREVYAIATSENLVTKARAGNGVITFEASKRGMERMQSKAAAMGAAGGIVRERWHDDGRDVGRCLVWEPDEDTRRIAVGLRISPGAEDTWQKVLDGTLLGVSVGGKVLAREHAVARTDGGGSRVVPTITDIEYDEIILTGSPSDPDCMIQRVYRTADGFDEVVGETDDLDVARAFSAAARQARSAQQHANAKGKTAATGTGKAKKGDGQPAMDKNNFVGKLGDKFVTYLGGKKVGEFDSQAEAEQAYNKGGGAAAKGAGGAKKGGAAAAGAAVAKGAAAAADSKAPKAGDTLTSKTAAVGQSVTVKGGAQGVIKTAPTADGNVDVAITSGPDKGTTQEWGADDGTIVARAEEGVMDEVARADETHGAFTGKHSHGHAANGAQGEDDSHEHEHSHDGDGDHGHAHDDGARAAADLTNEETATVATVKAGAATTTLDPKGEARVERTEEELDSMRTAVAAHMQLSRATIDHLTDADIEKVHRTFSEDTALAEAAAAEAAAEVAAAQADEVARTDPDPDPVPPAAAVPADDVARDALAELAIDGAAAGEGCGGGGSAADEETDASIGMQAIEYVNKLIARESAELANGDSSDACDVQSLMWIRDSLVHFVKGELLEAMEMKRTLVEALDTIAKLATDVKSYKALTADAVQRSTAATTQIEAFEAERAEVKRSVDPLVEKVDDLIQRVKGIEDTPIGGPVSKDPTSLDKFLTGDGGSRSAEDAAAVLERIKRTATPEMLRVIQQEETNEAIRLAHSRPQHIPPTRATMPAH